MSLYETFWSSPKRKTVTSMATLLSAVFGVIVGFGPAVDALDTNGWPMIATRTFVREQVAQYKNVVAESRAIRLDIATGKKEAAEGRLDQLELDYLKATNEEQKVLNLQAQRKQKDTIEKLKGQIEQIERPRP